MEYDEDWELNLDQIIKKQHMKSLIGLQMLAYHSWSPNLQHCMVKMPPVKKQLYVCPLFASLAFGARAVERQGSLLRCITDQGANKIFISINTFCWDTRFCFFKRNLFTKLYFAIIIEADYWVVSIKMHTCISKIIIQVGTKSDHLDLWSY